MVQQFFFKKSGFIKRFRSTCKVMRNLTICFLGLYSLNSYGLIPFTEFSVKNFLLGERSSEFKLKPGEEAQVESLFLKGIKAACKTLQEGKLEFFDGSDRTNQCHLNALLVVMAFQDGEFKQHCTALANLPAAELLKALATMEVGIQERLRFLTLNILRYMPNPDHGLNEILGQLDIKTKEEKSFFDKFRKGRPRVFEAINAELCAQLANVRLRLCEQRVLSIESVRSQIKFNIPPSLADACFITKFKNAQLPTLPKFLSIQIFLAAVQDPSLTMPPIYMKLVCNGKLVGYIDYTLQRFTSQSITGPAIFINTETVDKSKEVTFDQETGLLRGFTPQEIIMSCAAYFVEKDQPEGKAISRQYMPDFDEVLNKYLAIQKEHGVMILHMWPIWNE